MGFLDYFELEAEQKNSLDGLYHDDFLSPHSPLSLSFVSNSSHDSDTDDGYNEPNVLDGSPVVQFPTEYAYMTIELVSVIVSSSTPTLTTEYTYNLSMKLDDGHGTYVAYGEIKIYCAVDENNKKYLADVLVNNVSNGPLHDKYDDCFDIYPYEYLHILCQDIPCNFPYRPDFTDVLDEE